MVVEIDNYIKAWKHCLGPKNMSR